jgi:hypothetical protein
MPQRFIVIITVLVLAICLLSGGCQSSNEQSSIKSWRDLVDLLPEPQDPSQTELQDEVPAVEQLPSAMDDQETIEVMPIPIAFTGQTSAHRPQGTQSCSLIIYIMVDSCSKLR